MIRTTTIQLGVLAALSLGLATAANAAAITYTDRATFESALGASITDDYSAPGYASGDFRNFPNTDVHTNGHMSAVLGETEYQSTGHSEINSIGRQDSNPFYCAGCNGSFILSFITTSVGDGNGNGVFGVGFDFLNGALLPYHAFVTFGDLSTLDILLPVGGTLTDLSEFFAITSDADIRSIALGLDNGGTTTAGYFGIDNLTIGAAAADVPEPGTLALFGAGLAALGLARRRRAAA